MDKAEGNDENGVDSCEKIDAIEAGIDTYPLKLAIMEEPLQFSLWNVLTAHEHFCYGVLQGGDNNLEFVTRVDRAKYALKYGLDWLYSMARAGRSFEVPKRLKPARIREAAELFRLGLEYDGVFCAFTIYRRGDARCEIVGDSAIRFERDNIEAEYDILDRMLAEPPEPFMRNADEISAFRETLARVADSVQVVDDRTLCFSLLENDHRTLCRFRHEASQHSFLFPKDWSFRGIPIESFRRTWVALQAYYEVYRFCYLRSLDSTQTDSMSSPLAVDVKPVQELVQILCTYLPDEDQRNIREIIDLLTYSRNLSKADPALQPLIPLRTGSVGIAPHLVVSSRIERNTIALLARSYKDEYDRTTGLLEIELLNEMETSIASMGFNVVTRKEFPKQERLPDVDLAIFDSSRETLLLVEVKWVIPPGDVSEVYSRAESESNGIRQAKVLLRYATENPVPFWEKLFPHLSRPKELQLAACVCMRGFVGTARNFDSEAPTIEQSLFCRQLESVRNLRDVITWMRGREFLPKQGTDFVIHNLTRKIGPYTVYWPVYELIY